MNNNSLDTQLNAVQTWFQDWTNNNIFAKGIYWRLVKNATASRAGKNVYVNSNTPDFEDSLELLERHITNEYACGSHRLTVILSDKKKYDKDSPEKQLNFPENKRTIGSVRNNSKSDVNTFALFQQLLDQKDKQHEQALKHQAELNDLDNKKRDERIAGLENSQAETGGFWGGLERIIKNADKIEDIWERIHLAKKKTAIAAIGKTGGLGHKGFGNKRINFNQEQNIQMSEENNLEEIPLDYNRGISLLQKWHSKYPHILESLEGLHAAHQGEQSEIITQELDKLRENG